MTVIRLRTAIRAPIARCFDAARDIDLHVRSTAGTNEEAVAAGGVTGGLLGPGEWVTWRARHFGVTQSMTMRMAEFERPRRFVDEMVQGPFRRIRHVHEFTHQDEMTIMDDHFEYLTPLGPLGALADLLVLKQHMRGLLESRARLLRSAAEAGRSWGEE